MFSDVASSTAIASRLDPEEWRELLAGYHQIVTDAVAEFGGFVAKYLGDGVVAYFGWPIAHENDGERAALAARAIQERVAAQNRAAAVETRVELGVRIGLHAGEVVISESGEVFGDAPNVAARVQSVAEVGGVVVTDTVFRSIAGSIAAEPLGEHALRGVERPVHLHRLLPAGLPVRRLPADDTEFVGRREELGAILKRWELARMGHGQLIMLSGEPGIGKSRLVREFHGSLGVKGQVWLTSACSELFRSTPFHPIVSVLRRLVGDIAASPSSSRRRLQRILASAGISSPNVAGAIAELLMAVQVGAGTSHGPRAVERRNLQLCALLDWTLATARRSPVVLVLEDLHWADPSTLEFVEKLIPRLKGASILMMVSSRPGFRAPWTSGENRMEILLRRLSADAIRQIVEGTTSSLAMEKGSIETIVKRTSGIPLFAEELARLVVSRAGLSGGSDIPETIAASLNARLDQLGQAREVAQMAAVLGDNFSPLMLGAIAARPAVELDPLLDRLVEADVLSPRDSSSGRVLAFKHSLLKDAAYGSLLRRRRRVLHERAADVLEANFPNLVSSHPEVMARHLSAAARHDRAVAAWQTVGKVAEARAAYREAEEAYRQAIANLLAEPGTRGRALLHIGLQNNYVYVLQLTHGYSAPETAEAIQQGKELAAQIGGVDQSTYQVAAQWAALSSAGRYLAASQAADQFLALARHEGSNDSLANAHMIQMTSRHRLGDFAGADEHYQRGEPLFTDPTFLGRPGAAAQTFGNGGLNAWVLGRADEARRRMAHGLQATAGMGPYDVTFGKSMAAVLAVLMRESAEARDLARQSLELSDSHGFPQFGAISRVALGRALAGLGQAREGIDLINQGLAAMTSIGTRVAMTRYLAWLAEAHMIGGNPEQAVAAIDRALNVNAEELFFQPELLRLRGELRSSMGDDEGAEADIRAAISAAARMAASCFQLRAAVSLHRLLARVGGSAARLVASLYGAVMEGRASRDLTEAFEISKELDVSGDVPLTRSLDPP